MMFPAAGLRLNVASDDDDEEDDEEEDEEEDEEGERGSTTKMCPFDVAAKRTRSAPPQTAGLERVLRLTIGSSSGTHNRSMLDLTESFVLSLVVVYSTSITAIDPTFVPTATLLSFSRNVTVFAFVCLPPPDSMATLLLALLMTV